MALHMQHVGRLNSVMLIFMKKTLLNTKKLCCLRSCLTTVCMDKAKIQDRVSELAKLSMSVQFYLLGRLYHPRLT